MPAREIRRFSRNIIAGLLVALLAVALSRRWFSPVESVTLRQMSPFIRVIAGLVEETRGVLRSFIAVGQLSRATRIMEEENARLGALLARLESVEQENDVLRRQVDLVPRRAQRFIAADIVSRTTDGVIDGWVINKGSRDGVQTGSPVTVEDGVLVGRVLRTESLTSVVATVADASFRASVQTIGTRAEGLARGVRGIDVVLDTVPRTSELRDGDRVVTTGTDGIFPPFLYVGSVRSVTARANEIFQSARITPAVNFRSLRIVSVLLE